MKNQRREFIKVTGLAAIGAYVLPACTSSGSMTSQRVLQDMQPIGLQLYTLRNQLAKDLKGTLDYVASIGYQYVELFGYGDREYFGMPAADFYALLKDKGLEPRSSHHLSGLINPDNQGTLTNGWEQAIEDAAASGQQNMVCAWLFPQERESLDQYKKLAEILDRAGEQCRKAGITFCYHNHDFEFMEMEDEIPMYYLLDNTNPENVKVELDLYWSTKAGFDAVEFFEKYPGRVPLWHVKDMADTEKQEFTEVGQGTIDFKRIFENAELAGMKSFFVEQDESKDALRSIKTSFDFVQGNLV